MKKGTFFMLIGLPGVGKTSWIDEIYRIFHDNTIQVISTDAIIEYIAGSYYLNYEDVFNDISYAFAEKITHQLAPLVFKRNEIVIWDQTNLTIKARSRKLALVPENWEKVAVVFQIPDSHEERLASRAGKTIPKKVIEEMKDKFEYPTLSEGFNFIRNV